MALKSPMMPSPTTSFLLSDSPASTPSFSNRFSRESKEGDSKRSSTRSDTLAPPPSPYPQQIEPSPVDSNHSNGTENTEIEEEAQEEGTPRSQSDVRSPTGEDIASPQSASSDKPSKLNTQLTVRDRSGSQDDPQSVIHIPSSFRDFSDSPSLADTSYRSSLGLRSPATPEAAISPAAKTPPGALLNTDVPRVIDRSTPLAQTRSELEQEFRRRKRASMLADIPETNGKDADDDDEIARPSTAELIPDGYMSQNQDEAVQEDENIALTTALAECWTLCNTLATLSSSHRTRSFQYSGKQELQEQAWRSCWKLCQKLYESRGEDHRSQVVPTLELCRDFCQALFEVRQKGDDASDSVLRVSFELNNHLYNTHDRNLPDAFSERTLDFYITLCHRLTKQRTILPQETDALLRSCWHLAEMLFNLRQSRREGRQPDEEQLGSAVQACWDLCDLFREGWSHARPDRSTPRPSQRSFPSRTSNHSGRTRSTERSTSSMSDRPFVDASASVPETPTTIFDDTTAASSPDEVNAPNILVLGPARNGSQHGGSHHERWSSNASVMSDYSESAGSQRTSSTATVGGDDTHLNRLRYLLVRAAMNTGWTRTAGQLPLWAQSMSKTAFGTLPWQIKIFNYYQKLVTNDKSMINAHGFPSRTITAIDMARSVKWLGRNEQWAWMRDLFRIVYGFGVDEADHRGGSIHV